MSVPLLRQSRTQTTANLRILGVNIDDHLSFTEHISNICKKNEWENRALARLHNVISCKTKLQLHLTALLPHPTYCQSVWYFCKQHKRRKLQRLQEHALRAIHLLSIRFLV